MKKWKIVLITLFVLIAGGAGTLYYLLELKDYGTDDKKVAEIVKSGYEVILPGDKAVADKSKKATEGSASSTEGSEGSDATASTPQSSADKLAASIVAKAKTTTKKNTTTSDSANPDSESPSTPATSDPVTAQSIINKYQPSFENLQAQADGKLTALISYAIGEYQSKKASGEEVSYFYFYSKYTAAASSLEASTDASFNKIYGALTAELEANGFDASAAKGIKAQYNATKKAQRSALMNQAMSGLK
ncbi:MULTISPECIES: hypothetical protein [unclassified Bacillus (in: firmicutes)]|uniref:hypothetical protein n=1 Tax=unclassified Bacillus (in: firmicutes) TaxID=185979 RepID=UPI0008ECAAE3|nr:MULTISPECIES: hypothetical protein [unclassified Bacillus (in: firmicutes)]SFB04555.1 hypothetical protein SAMN02799634_104310 [Bacillus sp. UNCCL13]SFQ88486.1 hypothetical protein SAMN04488577_3205 [Bacillus sp. cl95]